MPQTFPGIFFDEDGVCNFCNQHKNVKPEEEANYFATEEELAKCLEKYRNQNSQYDVLVSLSGGVDSSYVLIKIVETFKLRPLGFHNDFSYSDETAVNNVIKLCKSLNVDYIVWRNDYEFMKKMWKYVNESSIPGMSACYFCGNIIHLNSLELADRFNIKLLINGLSKGQAWTINDVERTRQMMGEMVRVILKDEEFFRKYMQKNDMLVKQKFFREKQDLLNGVEPNKLLIIPFFIFNFYKTDKARLRKECVERFDWQEPKMSYPSRTTNCEMSWLNSYCDLQKMGYSTYHEEYAQLIREGEITREQALRDLELNPPEGLLEALADEIGMNLKKKQDQAR